MKYPYFLPYSLAATTIWALATLGYAFGEYWNVLLGVACKESGRESIQSIYVTSPVPLAHGSAVALAQNQRDTRFQQSLHMFFHLIPSTRVP